MADVNEATDTNETDGRSRMDAEVLQLQRILRQLSELEPAAQRRTVAWLADRFSGKDE